MDRSSRIMGRGCATAAVIGILVGAFFGRVWLNISASGFPGCQHNIEIAGSVVLVFFALGGVLVLLRVFHNPLYWSGQLPRSAWYIWFVILIVLEIALIAIGNNFFRENNLAGWKPAWTLFIVGTHFLGFAYIFHISAFYKLAAAMCAGSVLSVLISWLVGATQLWIILPGLSGALSLWWFTGWALYRMAHGRWIDIK